MKLVLTTLLLVGAATFSTHARADDDDALFTTLAPNSLVLVRGGIFNGWERVLLPRPIAAKATTVFVGSINDANGMMHEGEYGPALYSISAVVAPTETAREFKGVFKVTGVKNGHLAATYDHDLVGGFEGPASNIAVGTPVEFDCKMILAKGPASDCTLEDFEGILDATYGRITR